MKIKLLTLAFLLFISIALRAQNYEIIEKQYDYSDTVHKKVIIELVYPQMKNHPDKDVQNYFNDKVYADQMRTKEGFILEADPENVTWNGAYNGYYTGYEIVYKSSSVLSIVATDYFYTGGAHGMGIINNINYDLKNKKFLELNDILEGKYLEFLSEYSRNYLIKVLNLEDEEWIKTGTEPKAENFSCITFTKDTLTITFQSYQVTAYAYGNPEVKIPIKNISKYIRKDCIVYDFVK